MDPKVRFLDFVVLSYFGSLPFVDETASEVKIEVPVAMDVSFNMRQTYFVAS